MELLHNMGRNISPLLGFVTCWSGSNPSLQSWIVYPYKLLPMIISCSRGWVDLMFALAWGDDPVALKLFQAICHRKHVFFLSDWMGHTTCGSLPPVIKHGLLKHPRFTSMIFPAINLHLWGLWFSLLFMENLHEFSIWILPNVGSDDVRCLRHQSKALSSGTKAVPMQKSRPHRGPRVPAWDGEGASRSQPLHRGKLCEWSFPPPIFYIYPLVN